MDSLSILLLGVTLFLVEVQIVRIQSNISRLSRIAKSTTRGLEIQGLINESMCDTMGEILTRQEQREQ